MFNAIITHAQLIGIGFTFGIAGPCLFVCTPILITYLAAKKKAWHETFLDISVFLSGRLLSYMILGYAAGLSAIFLKKFTGPEAASFFKPVAGIISIFLGFLVLTYRRSAECEHKIIRAGKLYNFGGLFILGFIMGITPCAPLAMLLAEITLMSKSPFDGMLYALSFGAGTFLSGLLVVGVFAGILTWIPSKFLKSEASNLILRIVCAALLIMMGLGLII